MPLCVPCVSSRWEKEKRRARRNRKKRAKSSGDVAVPSDSGPNMEDDVSGAALPAKCDLGGWEMIHKAKFTVNRPLSCLNADFAVRGKPLIAPKRNTVRTLNLGQG